MATTCPKCEFDNPEGTRFCGNCAAPLHADEDAKPPFTRTLETPVDDLRRGTLFAERYEIIEKLETGGMGAVYRAEDTKIGQDIAVKLIKPEIASDIKTIERFRNELKTTRMISHRNVCRMFDLGETADTIYITMEYVPGEDLKSFIRRSGRLDIPKAISVTKQVSEGLEEAHRLGVVHRDLKSNNIMIDRNGNARIMDFGIARSVSAKGLTGEGIIIGTPEYMSPEQAEAKEVDQRSDIYSLGVILYEMVTGQLPFEGETPLSVAMKHKGEIPKDPNELNPQIPDGLSLAIMTCLEKDKEKRYQSAGELRSELENIEKGIPTATQANPEQKSFTSKEITVQLSLKKHFIPALIIVAVIILGLILWKLLPKKESVPSLPSDKPSIAILYFKNQTGDESLEHWREALPSWLITDLSQSKYIRVLPEDSLFSILRKLDLLEAQNYASEDLKNVAREGRVNHIFQASYSKAGDIFRIDYSLQKADTLERIASDYATGENEESFPSLIDEITKNIKANLALSKEQVSTDIDKNIGAITTSSPEAFKYYSLGRKMVSQRKQKESIELMEQAVAVDPEFAMAYRSMAMSYRSFGYRKQAKEVLQKAMKSKDRLSDRELLQIQADFYILSESTFNKAIEAYKALLEIYPDASTARHNLGVVYSWIGEYQQAAEQLEILTKKYKSDQLIHFGNLSAAYRALGSFDRARESYQYYLSHFPDNPGIHRSLALIYYNQGKYELALEEIDKALALAPTDWLTIRRRGDIYFYMGDFVSAEADYRMLLERDERSANYWGMLKLSDLFLIQGKFDDAIAQDKKALELAEELGEKVWAKDRQTSLAYLDRITGHPEEALKKLDIYWNSAVEEENLADQRTALHLKGLTHLEMKQTAEAQRVALELKEMIEHAPNKKLIRMYYHLAGMIEMERKNYAQAIGYLDEGLPLLYAVSDWRIIFFDSLGRAYYESGDLDMAKEKYAEILDPTTPGRLTFGDVHAKSYYMLGKINEELGDTAQAKEHFEKFLDLWKDADPGIAEVDDARQRLARLNEIIP